MVRLTKIYLYQLPELIELSYKEDKELLDKYHIKKVELAEAVYLTFQMIKNASLIHHLDCYKVIYENKPIGYTVTYENNNLYSYAIGIKYRKKEVLKSWWEQVKKLLSNDFMTMIYGNNERAKIVS